MILGTAGHIDHGKTTLVRALTGVDTDRLPEEKRRGITIELGFAPLELEGVGTVGVVDVPGHEAFVRTMLAGATGVDIALLVVAADEGVMPQTREHLSILSLLGVASGVVAVTKADLVDDDWLALVIDDLRQVLAAGPLGAAAVVPVSAQSGAGLSRLREALGEAARRVPARDTTDVFRMPIDRVFTVKGTGTVVTGTVWSGTLSDDALVRILPGSASARVRRIQSHGRDVPAAQAGHRVALSLAGVERDSVERGSWIVADARWHPTTVLRADVALLDGAPPLGPRTRVRFHLGTQDVPARVVARGGAITAGETRPVRIVCDQPVLARGGDRFVIRSASPAVTIAGGMVTDAAPGGRRSRPAPTVLPGARQRLAAIVANAGASAITVDSLPFRAGLPIRALREELHALAPDVVVLGEVAVMATALDHTVSLVRRTVAEHHAAHPLEPGAPLQAVRLSAPGAHPAVVAAAIERLVRDGEILVDGSVAKRAGWAPRLNDVDRQLSERVMALLARAAAEPPGVSELSAALGADVVPVLRFLEREGRVVPVEANRYYETQALERLLGALRRGMQPGQEYGPAELRDLLGFSRKFLIPFMEYCDRAGLTERRPGGRVRVGT